jgi:AcrR family transcriptional regulator
VVDEPGAAPESGTRARARRPILDVGVQVLSQQSGASLAEVADAAGVGRTTMHRFFPERADLLVGIGTDLLERIAVATERLCQASDVPEHDALALCLRTLRKVVAP